MKKIIFIIACCLCCVVMFSGCVIGGNKAERTLFHAITTWNLEGVREVINSEASIDYDNLPYKETTNFQIADSRALALAVDSEDAEIIETLLQTGEVEVEYEYVETAVCNYSLEIIELLLKYAELSDAKANKALEYYISFVHPYLKNNKERAELLLQNGAEINQKVISASFDNEWRYWYTPELLSYADKNDIPYYLEAGLEEAIKGDDTGLQKLISADKIKERELVLLFASAYCNTETLKAMDEAGYDFFVTDMHDLTPLHIACLCNDADVVNFLLEKGLNAEQQTEWNDTAITYAAIGGQKENLELLLSRGCDFQRGEGYDEDLPTSWTWAAVCHSGSGDAIETLLEVGYEPSAYDRYAIYAESNDDVFYKALEMGMPFDVEWDGSYPIESSVSERHTQILLDKGAKGQEWNIGQAVEWRNYKMLSQLLLDKERYSDECLLEAFITAIEFGDLESMKILVDAGVNVNAEIETEDGTKTPLEIAETCPSQNVITYLEGLL